MKRFWKTLAKIGRWKLAVGKKFGKWWLRIGEDVIGWLENKAR